MIQEQSAERIYSAISGSHSSDGLTNSSSRHSLTQAAALAHNSPSSDSCTPQPIENGRRIEIHTTDNENFEVFIFFISSEVERFSFLQLIILTPPSMAVNNFSCGNFSGNLFLREP